MSFSFAVLFTKILLNLIKLFLYDSKNKVYKFESNVLITKSFPLYNTICH